MSKIEVNQISSQCGSTLTIGQSGDTVTLASGATQTGFGRTGTVDWCTTAKTSPFTAVSGKGYFVNTTCAAVTVTLPATPTAGDIISVKDYSYSFATNNLTICNNGSNIGGQAGCVPLKYDTNGTSKTFVYADSTKGWLVVNESTDTSTKNSAPAYIVATGGTITCCGNYKIHTFTSDGTFTICSAPTPANNNVDYLVVAGGGGGGAVQAGGAGAGGYRESKCATTSGCWTASPLASSTSIPVSVQGYPIIVGAGGAAGIASPPAAVPDRCGSPGSNSSFSTITSTGGGGGPRNNNPVAPSGGSGSGGGGAGPGKTGGAGNTPPVSPPQGNPGGDGNQPDAGGGGGGGAGAAGSDSVAPREGGAGGAGITSSITASPVTRAGGGGGGAGTGCGGAGGPGGGGNGGSGNLPVDTPAIAGTANTGGGGGGGGNPFSGAAGGSGIVIIRYKYQ